ncbi:MAG TPA: hypothetical protein VFU07_07205 [Candidatus Lumbricidophila sp.]|nr:hypothetical protein [Candidatus Lumbricidophila sp.]
MSTECHEEVSRKGQLEPCDKVAVAMRYDMRDGHPYPVCAFHTRGADMVPLARHEDAIRAEEWEKATVEIERIAAAIRADQRAKDAAIVERLLAWEAQDSEFYFGVDEAAAAIRAGGAE